MKFYYRKHGVLGKVVHAMKVYDKMPESLPAAFRNSKLVCFDEIKVNYSLEGHAEVSVHEHTLTDKESLDKRLKFMVEIQEEKFNDLYNRCATFIDDIKDFTDEDIM